MIIDVQHDAVIVTIEDDGDGFMVMSNDNHTDCFGLIGMRERVNILNGELNIDSQQGSGTTILVKIPILSIPQVEN